MSDTIRFISAECVDLSLIVLLSEEVVVKHTNQKSQAKDVK